MWILSFITTSSKDRPVGKGAVGGDQPSGREESRGDQNVRLADENCTGKMMRPTPSLHATLRVYGPMVE